MLAHAADGVFRWRALHGSYAYLSSVVTNSKRTPGGFRTHHRVVHTGHVVMYLQADLSVMCGVTTKQRASNMIGISQSLLVIGK